MSQEESNYPPYPTEPIVRRESGTDWSDPRNYAGHATSQYRRSGRSHSRNLSLSDVHNLSDIDLGEKAAYTLDSPIFKKREETTHSELFYDLFFVANLTVFSSVKEINDKTSLSQYVGFFTIIWMTWFQVSMYDVRFSRDSFFDRFMKAMQFGVMIGLACNGPTFDVGEKLEEIRGFSENESLNMIADPDLISFKSLTLILMGSRLVLMVQYLQVLYLTRTQRDMIRPIGLTAGVAFLAALVYFVLFFAFQNLHGNAYITWYAVALIETSTCILVSSFYRVASFKNTHLVQRMSLLTLIVLGEGIIGLASRCQAIVKGQIFRFDFSTISNIACCILIIYLLHMHYTLPLPPSHFGTIRLHIHSLLHFPLHLSFLLAVNGAGQFTSWRAATVQVNSLVQTLRSLATLAPSSLPSLADGMQETIFDIMDAAFHGARGQAEMLHYDKANETAFTALDVVRNGEDQERSGAVRLIYETLINCVYTSVGFSAPDADKIRTLTSSNLVEDGVANAELVEAALADVHAENVEVFGVAGLILVYFFVAVGSGIMIMGVMSWIWRSKKGYMDMDEWIRIVGGVLIGAALMTTALLALDFKHGNGQLFLGFVYSPWVLPLVMTGLLIVVVLQNMSLPGSPASVRRAFRKPIWKKSGTRTRHSF